MLNVPHGNAKVYWQQHYLVLDLAGSFNLEGVQLANQKLKNAVNGSTIERWILVIKLAPETLLTSDSLGEVTRIMAWSSQQNCQYVAYITDKMFYESLIAKMFIGIELQYKVFTSFDSADKWFTCKSM